ncbi:MULTISPECIES: ribosome maturation factor RimM [unclassified Avibacterium]|uniref:ribosome maturation factor RimM n=1 Tax=unclassified Avibacterium TaxID=2685287 RepID=UPI002026611C|nr:MULTISPECIES: ribosome maturation factor RimM [unclassified Avibacterium]URL02264.1 ribosome maturation factor RimM [Avibacterium sp. 20-126]MCW9698882.1 ribosome maturation factor RimM [Avibacterium sp. 20-129]MCW9717129.1 ribosome maturation factor RimM [Avibacterium sp. 21-599]MCW9732664.1 ribosome maturation factor RimM [Avibacterium sp. 20-15]URL04813.1 ribosome maturation factor RimM [Avibacterium sp. 20-132]
MTQQRIEVVGKLGSTYGIRGWLRIYSSTEQAESIFDYQPWFLKIKGQWQATELESWKHHNHELIVKLKGINDREMAQTLANIEIGVDLSVFPQLEEGDYYWHDLIGCDVVNLQGYKMGKVAEMMETGSNDVLVVRANSKDAFGKQERLIPFLYGQVVKRVDLTTKTIDVEWDAGF